MKRRSAFTLVEVLMAAAVLSIMAAAAFKIFGSTNRANVQSLWMSKAQNEARALLSLLRNDMSKATCPSTVTDTAVQRDACTFTAAQGASALPGDKALIEFQINTPEVATATDNTPGTQSDCALRSFGTTLNYTRQGTGPPALNRDMVEDVVRVEITVRANAGEAFDNGGSVLDIEIEMRHPNVGEFPNVHLIEKTTARVPVPLG